MKRLLFSLALCAAAVCTWAAKAIPTPLSYTQPDGTTITVVMHGDEDYAWFTTTDGVFLCREKSGFYISEIRDGQISASGILAHNSSERNSAELNAIAKQDRHQMVSKLDTNIAHAKKIGIAERTPAYVAHNGSPKILVILAEYSDYPFSVADPKKSFEQFFNAEGEHFDYGNSENRNYLSVREYFNVMSDCLFTPEFEVVGPVKVGTMNSYGGTNENSPNDENTTQLTIDAIAGMEQQINVADYDADGDNAVDLVYIVYSGYGQNAGGAANTVWAKTSSFNRIVNDVKYTWFSCASELNLYPEYFESKNVDPYINGIGVTCHEIGHALGLPDIYPTSASAHIDNQEMEYWDIMDGGEYIYNGYRPKDYTGWEREVMGWKNIELLSEDIECLQIKPLLDGGKAYKFVNPANEREYFVLENVQKQGLNKSMPGHGLVVYHVNWQSDEVAMNMCPNNIAGKPGMGIVPADGACLSSYLDYSSAEYRTSHEGDPFPGSTGLTELNYTQELPNYNWYNGDAKVQNALYDIAEDTESGIVTLSYTSDYDAHINSSVSTVTKNNWSNRYFNLQGQQITRPEHGIYITEGKKISK